jgi:hypothetical protein
MPSWSEILNKVQAIAADKQASFLADLRYEYIEKLAQKTGRNVIAYYSSFLQKPTVPDISINV